MTLAEYKKRKEKQKAGMLMDNPSKLKTMIMKLDEDSGSEMFNYIPGKPAAPDYD